MPDSEAESGADATVTLAQDYVGRNNKTSEQRAIKLTELGPRMELQLVKIQSGLCDGEVLFHEFSKYAYTQLFIQLNQLTFKNILSTQNT